MDSKVNYVAVGMFVLALLTVLIGVFIWLTTLRLSEPTLTYVTYLRDEVSGLGPRSPVRFNGVEVGYVSAIQLAPKDPQIVKVEMHIKRSTPITTATVATLMSEGITGVNYIGLKATKLGAPALRPTAQNPTPQIPSEHSFLVKMSDALQQVTSSVVSLTNDIHKVFDEKNREAVAQSLRNIEAVTRVLANNTDNMNVALQSASVLLKNTAQVSEQFPQLIKEVNTTLQEVKQTASGFAIAVDQSHALIPAAQQVLLHVDTLSNTLQQVAAQMKQNPGVLVRGTATPTLGPGEKP